MPDIDSERLKQLISAFKSAEEQVQSVLLDTNAKSVEDYRLKVDKKLDKVSVSLMRESIDWAEKDLPKAYREGEKGTDGRIGGSHGLVFGTLKDAAIETPYIELARHTQYANDYQKKIIDDAISEAEKDGYGATVSKVKDIIQDTLAKDNASMIVQYSNGAKMPLEKYAEMLARTSRIETANRGGFDRALKNGIDLVRCTKVPNCCPYCQMFEDKVYSLTGKDKRFPYIYDTALQRGYDIMHPNCRHEFPPFIEEMYAQEELQELIEKSNYFKELSPDDKLFKIYNRNQALLRQYNEERKEFKEWQIQLGDENPYKTLGGFRRAKRSGSETYTETKKAVVSVQKLPDSKPIQVSEIPKKVISQLPFNIKSDNLLITYKQLKKHIETGSKNHESLYKEVAPDLPKIMSNPDRVFLDSSRKDTALFYSAAHKAIVVVKFSTITKKLSNTIITIHPCGNRTIKKYINTKKTLYKKE